jgi:RimJ/RimL family protein N-acetyltransferase
MLIRKFTEEDYPAMVNIHSSLNIVWPERPHTPEAWATVDRNRSSKNRYQRWVATEDRYVAGFSSYSQNPTDYPPRSYYINVEVHPEFQHRGIAYATAHGFRFLKTCTAIQNAPMQALFNKHGYVHDPEWQQCQKDING